MSEEEFRKQQIDLLSSIKNSIGCVQTILVIAAIVGVALFAIGGCTALMCVPAHVSRIQILSESTNGD